MERTVGIGIQSFDKIIENKYFYIDKTDFIREWWENGDDVTLITRPRRFGKTLNMSMTEQFFSIKYAGRSDLFAELSIWRNEAYRRLQGTYPVISLSFANIKETNYKNTRDKVCQILTELFRDHNFLLNSEVLSDEEKEEFKKISVDMDDVSATLALHCLSKYLYRYYGKKVIILLDEYDTPMQEAYVNGYWEELVSFTRGLFNAAFKTNPWLERGIMTGITRVSKESMFSDLNNLEVVTTTSKKYETAFGFTEQEVFTAMEEYGLSDKKEDVKSWYDGFTFGKTKDIYNPWSIINYLDKKELSIYWANTSSNHLIGKLIREGTPDIKMEMEELLQGKMYHTVLDEQIVFNQLDGDNRAIWSLLLASGYLKVERYEMKKGRFYYSLSLTNYEVRYMFEEIIEGWFSRPIPSYNSFIKALLSNNLKEMNLYMNEVALKTFSYFDTGSNPSRAEPERFYHGFVLGLLVELSDRYILTSNRESGYGKYDVVLEPKEKKDNAYVLEFKIHDAKDEKNLEDTAAEALRQIKEKDYATVLRTKGIPKENIYSYGFAFAGKKVLIGTAFVHD